MTNSTTQTTAPALGEKAPNFVLPDQQGVLHQLSDYAGKWVLLYFYPKDDTPGCTTQACGLRDAWQEFKDRGIVVFGLSKDSTTSHKSFANKHQLPFSLLSDPEGEVCSQYGVLILKKLFGKTYAGIARTSFLIDQSGVIRRIYHNVKPAAHAHQIVSDLDSLQR